MTMWSQLTIRQGDRLPALAVVLEEDDGTPIPLDPALNSAKITFTHHRTGEVIEVDGHVVGQTPPVVVYDWQAGDTAAMPIGSYDLAVSIGLLTGGVSVTVPTRRDALLEVRPAAPNDAANLPVTEPAYWDDFGDATRWDDPTDLVRWR